MTIFRFDHPTCLTKGYNYESYGQLNLTRRNAIRGMNMSKQMVLVARTNKVGSDSECGLGITEDEWDKLTEEEQSGYINTAIDNLVDWYVKTEG